MEKAVYILEAKRKNKILNNSEILKPDDLRCCNYKNLDNSEILEADDLRCC